ncbi:MAG TPA: hypothetical protein VMV21_20600 [Vicinamibacteria bacterium]|nr:hypothetical protein [Vicinamibacteria bacterium]
MIDDDTLQREIDREHGPEESERLHLELQRQPEALERYERLVRLVRTLESIKAAEPPVDFVQAVMRAVRTGASPSAARRADPARPRWSDRLFETARGWLGEVQDGRRTSERMLLAVGGVALAALGYFTVRGFPPADRGTQATAGAARRLSEPVAKGDAARQGALVQEFMASDPFRTLMNDEAARAALADPGVRAALSQPAVTAAFADGDPRSAITRPAVQALLAEPGVAAALARASVTVALAQPGFAAALASPRFVAALSDASAGSPVAKD